MENYSFLAWLFAQYTGTIGVLHLLDELEESQWFQIDMIKRYQLEQVKKILSYAQQNTLYYKKLFDAVGFDPTGFSDFEDLKQIPILTKSIIRERQEDLKPNRNDLSIYQTGGSTGVPLTFYCNDDFLYKEKAAINQFAYRQGGYKMGDRLGIVWGFEKEIPKRSWKQKIINNCVTRYIELNSFNMSEEKMKSFLQMVYKKRVPYIKGYANSLVELAKYSYKCGFEFNNIKAVFSEAEKLDDTKRSLIETAFNCKVFNYYGCREFSTIATECSAHEGLHINFQQLYVELMDDHRILITSFKNLGTPFIRYEIGDCADEIIQTPCSCGRQSFRIKNVLGRISDNFKTKDGRIIHGEYIAHLFYHTQAIKQFQIIQKDYDKFDFNLCTDDRNGAEQELMLIKKEFTSKFPPPLHIDVNYVSNIPKTDSGKNRFTISLI